MDSDTDTSPNPRHRQRSWSEVVLTQPKRPTQPKEVETVLPVGSVERRSRWEEQEATKTSAHGFTHGKM